MQRLFRSNPHLQNQPRRWTAAKLLIVFIGSFIGLYALWSVTNLSQAFPVDSDDSPFNRRRLVSGKKAELTTAIKNLMKRYNDYKKALETGQLRKRDRGTKVDRFQAARKLVELMKARAAKLLKDKVFDINTENHLIFADSDLDEAVQRVLTQYDRLYHVKIVHGNFAASLPSGSKNNWGYSQEKDVPQTVLRRFLMHFVEKWTEIKIENTYGKF